MQIIFINQFRFYKRCSLLFLLCLVSNFAYADSEVIERNKLCVCNTLNCSETHANQGKNWTDALYGFLDLLNQQSLSRSDLKDSFETDLQIKEKISNKRFQKNSPDYLDNLVSNSGFSLVGAPSPVLECKDETPNKLTALGVLMCGLLGFVVHSNKRRI